MSNFACRVDLRKLGDFAAGQSQYALGDVGDIEENVENRIVSRFARRPQCFDDFFERHVLIGIGVETNFTDALKQTHETWIAGQIDAQRQSVDEKTDQTFGLGVIASGDRRAHDDVFLTADARQQNIKRREERHEHRDACWRLKIFSAVVMLVG